MTVTDSTTFKLYIIFNTAVLITATLVSFIAFTQNLQLEENQEDLLNLLNITDINFNLNAQILEHESKEVEMMERLEIKLNQLLRDK